MNILGRFCIQKKSVDSNKVRDYYQNNFREGKHHKKERPFSGGNIESFILGKYGFEKIKR